VLVGPTVVDVALGSNVVGDGTVVVVAVVVGGEAASEEHAAAISDSTAHEATAPRRVEMRDGGRWIDPVMSLVSDDRISQRIGQKAERDHSKGRRSVTVAKIVLLMEPRRTHHARRRTHHGACVR
jgi:hypothetical protein